MLQRKHRGKMVTCYVYGKLFPVRSLAEHEEEKWYFEYNDNEDLMVNYNLIQALNNLSLEGWELVIQHELGFILRKQIRRHVPEASL
ncbi:hypothetical protein C2I18_25110 [Paenibacillus sp. PK3_47]|uniref:hypothetical protein n=1 Tax=Paenibacillus sp. PK3_47 TaxID=2072642 RepID=UPI00201DADD2|nr:hypothetical protein [Paenibacillus sp. PK3_47]UQZ36524.1 hypothetical protein C2I18_25110 [Paenibacillus sp. PK3_47]